LIGAAAAPSLPPRQAANKQSPFKWQKTSFLSADAGFLSANEALMMPNERRIKLNKALFCQKKGLIMPNE
jgi:hypothetical protein